MSAVNLNVSCKKCGNNFNVVTEIDPSQLSEANLRCKAKPISTIKVYRITSEMMRNFIIAKAKHYCPDAKVEVVSLYCEKKRRKSNELHHSYASLRIAFSEQVIDNNEDLGWFGKLGDSADNINFKPSIFHNLIQKYRFNPEDVKTWMNSYKNLEELEDGLGMSEAYINDIRKYSNPQRVKVADSNEDWIIFAAAAENVLQDMFTDPETNKVPGRIQIQDVYQIDKDVVEFIVYLHPLETEIRENPNVRKILLGEDKPKK